MVTQVRTDEKYDPVEGTTVVLEKDHFSADSKTGQGSDTQGDYNPVGRAELHEILPPHDSFEGYDRWDPEFTWTKEEEIRVRRKTDLKLMTIICIMFGALQLDRGNLSNALADNLLADIGVTTNTYNDGTTIQLVAFLSMEFPSQLLASRLGFSKWLPFLMFAWGTVSCFQAFMTNKTGFLITRALIGAFEGGFIPASIAFISHFYTSSEMAIRLAIFWSTLNVARVVSALLAAGILTLRSAEGRPGWFWLFIIEGGWTMAMAPIAYFWLPWSPVKTKGGFWKKSWYTPREEQIMVNRVLRDDPAKGLNPMTNKITFKDCREAWNDKLLWCLLVVAVCAYVPPSPVQAYLTYSLKQLGFTAFHSNLLTIPSAVLQIITMLTISYSSDFFNERAFHCLFGAFWSLPCLIALQAMPDGHQNWARFTLATLVAGYPYFHPIVTAWISENAFSVKRRSIQITTYNVFVQIGSIIGSQIYRKDDAPFYHRGNWVLISICILSLTVFLGTWVTVGWINNDKRKKWDKFSPEAKKEYQDDLAEREKEGPNRLDFRYTR